MRLPLIASLVFASAGFAAPADVAVVAAMKLPDAPNYSWITTVDDDARTYTISGQTERKDNYSRVEMPLISSLRRRMGRSGGSGTDAPVTFIFKGDENLVVDMDDQWKKPSELTSSDRSGRGGPGGGYGGRRGRGGSGGSDSSDKAAYSNLQLTLSRPHDEIAIIIANSSDLRVENDSVTGSLSETGAELLLVHAGQEEIAPVHATGTFRIWVKDGMMQKYQLSLQGTLAITTSGTRHEVQVHQRSTTVLKNVGTTQVDIPDEARKKLGA